jgi:hypothetical protein
MSTKRKNASLSALENGLAANITLQSEAAPDSHEAQERKVVGPKKKKMQLPTYPPFPVHEQLRRLAFEERTSINALTLEAWDLLFKKRGLKSIAELTREE